MLDFIISLITFPISLVDWVLGSIFSGLSSLASLAMNITTITLVGYAAHKLHSIQYYAEERRARQEMRKARHTWK